MDTRGQLPSVSQTVYPKVYLGNTSSMKCQQPCQKISSLYLDLSEALIYQHLNSVREG